MYEYVDSHAMHVPNVFPIVFVEKLLKRFFFYQTRI